MTDLETSSLAGDTSDGPAKLNDCDNESTLCSTEAMAVDLDEILKELGQFGRYQALQYVLISFPILFTVISGAMFVFTAGDLHYRCRIPECETNGTEYLPQWLQQAVPFENRGGQYLPRRCHRYEVNVNHTSDTCDADMFLNTTVVCNDLVFQTNETTIANEFDLTCDENQWKLTLVGTVNSIGYFVTTPIAGYASDRFGRKTVLLATVGISGVAGVARSFATSYLMFLIMEFTDMVLGGSIYETAFVIGMEMVGPDKRVLGGAIISAYNGVGEVFLGLIAWIFPNWRSMLRFVYTPCFVILGLYWFLPESIRWLMSQGRMEEADKIIRRAARMNGVVLSDKYLDMMRSSTLQQRAKEDAGSTDSIPLSGVLKQVFQSRVLLMRLSICCCCSAVNMFVFYGLSLNSVTVAGSKYLNFILVSLTELPGYFATYLAMGRIGRKFTLCSSLAFSGACCLSYIFVDLGMDWVRLLLFMLGKFGITISFTVMYVYATEMFPTQLRHSLLGTCSMFGGMGITVAPQTPLLSRYMESLPLLLFGGMSMVSAVLALFLPETLGMKLPDTVEEAEKIGRKPIVPIVPIVPIAPVRRYSHKDIYGKECLQTLKV